MVKVNIWIIMAFWVTMASGLPLDVNRIDEIEVERSTENIIEAELESTSIGLEEDMANRISNDDSTLVELKQDNHLEEVKFDDLDEMKNKSHHDSSSFELNNTLENATNATKIEAEIDLNNEEAQPVTENGDFEKVEQVTSNTFFEGQPSEQPIGQVQPEAEEPTVKIQLSEESVTENQVPEESSFEPISDIEESSEKLNLPEESSVEPESETEEPIVKVQLPEESSVEPESVTEEPVVKVQLPEEPAVEEEPVTEEPVVKVQHPEESSVEPLSETEEPVVKVHLLEESTTEIQIQEESITATPDVTVQLDEDESQLPEKANVEPQSETKEPIIEAQLPEESITESQLPIEEISVEPQSETEGPIVEPQFPEESSTESQLPIEEISVEPQSETEVPIIEAQLPEESSTKSQSPIEEISVEPQSETEGPIVKAQLPVESSTESQLPEDFITERQLPEESSVGPLSQSDTEDQVPEEPANEILPESNESHVESSTEHPLPNGIESLEVTEGPKLEVQPYETVTEEIKENREEVFETAYDTNTFEEYVDNYLPNEETVIVQPHEDPEIDTKTHDNPDDQFISHNDEEGAAAIENELKTDQGLEQSHPVERDRTLNPDVAVKTPSRVVLPSQPMKTFGYSFGQPFGQFFYNFPGIKIPNASTTYPRHEIHPVWPPHSFISMPSHPGTVQYKMQFSPYSFYLRNENGIQRR